MQRGAVGLVLGMLVVLLALAGCGGSETSSLNKSEFVKQANLACQEGLAAKEEKIQAAVARLGGRKVTRSDQEKLILTVLVPYEEATEKIDELDAPQGEEAKIQAIVEAREEAVARTKADPGTALVSSTAFEKATKLAANYGLDRCQF